MADSKREIERKYEATDATRLPALDRVAGVGSVTHEGVTELDAVYYDTGDLRLAAAGVTLRRRTGGADAGWHLKLPVAAHVRDEIRAPLSDTPPARLTVLIRSRTLDAPVVPVVRLRSARDVHVLTAPDGTALAELSVDEVRAERLHGGDRTAAWTEIEVELADDGDPAFLDTVERHLEAAGIRPSASSSKLARALTDTAPDPAPAGAPPDDPATPHTAGDHVLAYVRRQAAAITALDPAVRRGLPDSVHRMRVATRRLRSALRTHRRVLDRDATAALGAELKWLAGELGVDRDQEVLDARLRARLGELSHPLAIGPVRARLRLWSAAGRSGSRRRTTAVLDSARYLDLLRALEELLAAPPLLPGAGAPPGEELARAARKDHKRLAGRIAYARELPAGPDRDAALHSARKAAKRARYAAEAARPALGRPAKKAAKRLKAVQSLLGDHQDGVVARETLRALAVQAHAAGEPSFTWGLVYGREEAAAAAAESELPGVWHRAARARIRRSSGG
ncbi:CYTH and CHAD domain-containing protein [Streptomyces sp. NBC_00525]|uniref:CYTH and CHAD domain-containing protein n=1 Tax=Streptomyces sp. NBC_00525 TaxID=2903660 RepID=UPI002E7FC866|nr:CYTH and CHAD domain-containing protein [Streptomyces sp. NBC_00525]WUC93623.1 CYTH and CHAD domain-containing protein [Streptomyces sp. NBC_00525]